MIRLVVAAVWLVLMCSGCSQESPSEPPPTQDAGTVDAAPPADNGPAVTPPWEVPERDLVRFVDPMIGTDGPGNVIPGAVVPHGMVRASPDTDEEHGGIDAYEWSDPRIEGFTHTHLEGPGGSLNGYSQVLLMPTSDADAIDIQDWAAPFGHEAEHASPGRYSVVLDDGVAIRLTASAHAAVHEYTWPAGALRRVILDLGHSNGEPIDGHIEIVDSTTVAGYGTWNVHPLLKLTLGPERPTGEVTVWFRMTLDQPIASSGFFQDTKTLDASGEATGNRLGVGLVFDGDGPLTARVGISFVDADQATTNLQSEVAGVTFEDVANAAAAAWNTRLNRVQIDGSDTLLTRFYTALYHTMLQPADHTESGGRFASAAGGEHEVFEAGERRFYTDDWCMWDTFRTSHPLATLLEPETRGDVIWSMLHVYEQGGWLPKCTWTASGYSRVMIGNHAVPIIADAAAKGLLDFDPNLAWAAVEKAGMQDTSVEGDWGLCGYLNLGTTATYIELGYVPSECDSTQSVSMTLEYAYNDWTTARLADALGRADDGAGFDERAGAWKAHWDPQTGFMRPRTMDGAWKEPFDPSDGNDDNDFCEATSWIYSFFVPHDVGAMIELMGGDAAFVERLDAFFDGGHYDPSNQPSFHIPWLYNRAGAPAQAQQRVRAIMDEHFTVEAGGLPGNDDAGSMSAWFVLSALGLYPLAPGSPVYELGSPLVDRATVHLHPQHYDGGTFVIEAVGNSATNVYIQAAELNGTPLKRAWIAHDEIAAGGVLRLTMGPEPSTWGATSDR